MKKNFDINSLTVWHRVRDLTGAGMAATAREQLQTAGFFVTTCMREFAVSANPPPLAAQFADDRVQCLQGTGAYAFLLRTVTGLNSSIPGETNIQGQIRKAWDNWRRHQEAGQVAEMNPVMHRLFTDSRHIRRQYLQGIGGHSYGSLARKLLNPDSNARILLIGAGELARSVAPFFSQYETAVWNRHATDAAVTGVDFAFAPEASSAAARWATHAVVTTPPDHENDRHWADLLQQQQVQKLVHLGLRRARRGSWQDFSQCHDLDDVIAYRQTQSSLRSFKLRQASEACDTIAHELKRISGAPARAA